MLPEPKILPSRAARSGPAAATSADRLRRALWRSFLRYGVAADLDTAVHAAMNVIGPVLEAKDAEITRLRQAAGRVKPRARPRPGSARIKDRPVTSYR